MLVERKTLLTTNGNQIVATKYIAGEQLIATVVIAPAMGVTQSFYAQFAKYLAEQGFIVWSFDYSGIGESKNGNLSECVADINDWVKDNYDFVVQTAIGNAPNLRVFAVGHSLGGQITPLLPSAAKLAGLVNVAVGSGSAQHLRPNLRRFSPFLWYVFGPVLCTVFGYFPGKLLHFVGDIPRNAFMQWRSWCIGSEYLLSAEKGALAAYVDARFPVLSLTFSDDEMLSEEGSLWLHRIFYKNTVDYQLISPSDLGMSRIGHFGFFHTRSAMTLWPTACTWIRKHAEQA